MTKQHLSSPNRGRHTGGGIRAALSIIPLIYYQVLPVGRMLTFIVEPPSFATEPELPPPIDSAPSLQRIREVRISGLHVPLTIPDQILPERPEVPDIAAVFDQIQREAFGLARPSSQISASLTPGPLPPPPPPPRPTGPVRVGGNVQASKLLQRFEPVYPELARRARVSGTVVLQVIVDEIGGVSDVKVISGHPLLTEAAANAVRQWKYSPTLLNGEPVPVIATVTVQFVLH